MGVSLDAWAHQASVAVSDATLVTTWKQKFWDIYWFLSVILMIKEFCNLTGWEHFGQYYVNQNFPEYVHVFLFYNNFWHTLWRNSTKKSHNPILGSLLAIFTRFWPTKIFHKKYGSVSHISKQFVTPWWVSKKRDGPIARNIPDRRTETRTTQIQEVVHWFV